MKNVDFALQYLNDGVSVIPLKPKEKKPAIPSWNDFQKRFPTVEEIQEWWATNPNANIGIVTGAISGIVALDVDAPDKEGDVDGRISFEKLIAYFGPLPETAISTTGGGGRHIIFKHPGFELRNFSKKKRTGLDFRGDGGYITAAPSIHPNGTAYKWLSKVEPAEMPDWLIKLASDGPEPEWFTELFPPAVKSSSSWEIRPKTELEGGNSQAEIVLRNCVFCQHCRDNASTLSEPEWYAMITNLARTAGGHELIHELSRPDSRYNVRETDRKIEHALQDGEPQTCQFIQDNLGFAGCPSDGCGVKAPVGFVSSPLMLAKITVESAIGKLGRGAKCEIAFKEEYVGALAVLKDRDAAEYGKAKAQLKEACGTGLNLNDLEKAVKQKQAQQQNLRLVQPNEKPPVLEDILPELPVKGLRCPDKWYVNEKGVWQDTQHGLVCICAVPVLLTKRLKNIDSSEEKIELAFYRDGHWHYISAPRPTVFHRMTVVNLAAQSLPVSSETSKDLVRYFLDFESANLDTLPVVRSVSHMGWVGSNRFLPGADENIHLDVDLGGSSSIVGGYRSEGTLEEWVQFITPMRAFPIARFTLAASFAAPLLELVSQRVFIVHNWGPSRGGKTASLKAALSVWGEPDTIIASFNATKVGLERLAAFFSDLPLGIDERQVVGDQQGFVESLVYLLGLGKGKARGSKGGGLQAFQTWRTIALTTGEQPLSTNSSTQGIKTRALEIYGVPIKDEILAQKLHQGIAVNFGTAGPVFIQRLLVELANDPNAIKNDYQSVHDELQRRQTEYMGSHLSAIATVMLADYYASMWIFGIDKQQAKKEAVDLAELIMTQLETAAEADDAARAMEYFVSWCKVNENSFGDSLLGREWFGLRQAGNMLIVPMIFDRMMQEGGFNEYRVLRDWADRGWIETEVKPSDGKRRIKIRKMINGESHQFISVRTHLAFQSDQKVGEVTKVTKLVTN